MKIFCLVIATVILSTSAFSQKQSFDVVSYSTPKGWQQQQNEGGLQLSITDKKTGGYALAVITKARASTATANENFITDWDKLVKSTVQVNGEPEMQEPTIENGWDIISGCANYTDGGNTGMATLLTATGGGQMVSVVLMTNAKQYQNDLLALINSLELSKASQYKVNINSSSAGQSNTAAVVGLWCVYILETTGYYSNGQPQYTGGYLRKEYSFNPDGTYIFRNKQWLTKSKDILFIYENGTYTVNGNQITLSPKNGKGQFWSKTSSTKEWGKLLKSSEYKLEKVTYSFEIIDDPAYGHSIKLKPGKPTQRDGGKFNAPNDTYEFRYKNRGELGSLIDNPPGFKN
ncbi:MAG: hypothetical protein IPO46_12395 [Chitinophagaceae bacterium]|jgi:hypothetical protein|nr:hypothetical protein [Chitinophagaceae bacterium]MBP6371145.1 hypothetical protein [Ferruginibacter sp.]NMD29527.1 hypothetical protein [Bacteroidota bacterium]MBK7087590.1 hypothetical protein [Chitinophagaceae bacterium]MBK7346360.1 hypothetical protein [Chitinophagaceae bacterium]